MINNAEYLEMKNRISTHLENMRVFRKRHMIINSELGVEVEKREMVLRNLMEAVERSKENINNIDKAMSHHIELVGEIKEEMEQGIPISQEVKKWWNAEEENSPYKASIDEIVAELNTVGEDLIDLNKEYHDLIEMIKPKENK